MSSVALANIPFVLLPNSINRYFSSLANERSKSLMTRTNCEPVSLTCTTREQLQEDAETATRTNNRPARAIVSHFLSLF